MEGKKKILIVEDNRIMSLTLKNQLEEEGFDVTTAYDGYEGIYKAKNSGEDLLILNLRLPGISGEEICKELRKEDKFEKLPIIMLTEKDSDVDKVVGMVIGANCYRPKPFKMDDLLTEIRSLISEQNPEKK